jgi:hypothetical protein
MAMPVNGICGRWYGASRRRATYQIKYGQHVVNASISRHDEAGINAQGDDDVDKHHQDDAKDDQAPSSSFRVNVIGRPRHDDAQRRVGAPRHCEGAWSDGRRAGVGVGRGRLKVGCSGEGGFKSRADAAQLDEELEGAKSQGREHSWSKEYNGS